MAELLRVPEVAAGATEVLLAEWLVDVGAQVEAGDPIAVLETDKATVEVEADAGATLLVRLVEAGKQVDVGAPMAVLGSQAEAGQDPATLLAALGATLPTVADDVPRRDEEGGAPVPATSVSLSPTAQPDDTRRIFASPLARKLLREAGIGLDEVAGSGPRGRIMRRDVDEVLAARGEVVTNGTSTVGKPVDVVPVAETVPTRISKVPTGARSEGDGTVEEVPHARIRQAIARILTTSKQTIPHFYVRRTVVVDELLALRARVNEEQQVRVSVNDFVLRAVALTHQEVPEANVVWTETAMRRFERADIAVAIDSARGLVTPVLRGVEAMTLGSISAAVKRFAERADAGALVPADLEGGSISVTNLGMFGVEEFAAIINPPHSAILAVGAAAPTARVVEGEVRAVTAMTLVLSVDHRAIDGVLAARWMEALVRMLGKPLALLV